MPANTSPIFSVAGDIQWSAPMYTFNASFYITGGTIYQVFSAGTNGSYVQKIRFRHLGTNVATVARVFINNGSTTATVTNSTLWDEITIGANTASQAAASINYELPLGFALPAGYIIYCTFGTSIVSGLQVSVVGGDY